MQQGTPPMMPVMPSFPSANITTEQIQKCLDENKKLILAILDNQNLGKLAECAQCYQRWIWEYQAQLQKNLMYLAAIADAQPQISTVPAQMPPHPAMQQGAYYMQQQAPQQGLFPPRMPTQFASPLQLHEHQQQQQQQQLHQQHQQTIPGQVNFRPTGPSNSMTPMQTDGTLGGSISGGTSTPANASDARGGKKQDGLDSGHVTGSIGDGQGSSAPGTGETKGSEEGK